MKYRHKIHIRGWLMTPANTTSGQIVTNGDGNIHNDISAVPVVSRPCFCDLCRAAVRTTDRRATATGERFVTLDIVQHILKVDRRWGLGTSRWFGTRRVALLASGASHPQQSGIQIEPKLYRIAHIRRLGSVPGGVVCRAPPKRLAQYSLVPQDCADVGRGRLSRNSTWHDPLVGGETPSAVSLNCFDGQFHPGLGTNTLTAEPLFLVGHTDTGRLQHPGQTTTTCSDFTGEYIEAGHQKSGPSCDPPCKRNPVGHGGDAAGQQPAIAEDAGGFLGRRRSRASPAGRGRTISARARRQFPAFLVADLHLGGWQRQADATGEILDIDRIDADAGAFGQAIARQDRHPGQVRQRSATVRHIGAPPPTVSRSELKNRT